MHSATKAAVALGPGMKYVAKSVLTLRDIWGKNSYMLHNEDPSAPVLLATIGMPQSGSEPKFEPELFRTGPKFGPRFGWKVEPDHKSGSRFEQG